MKKRKDGLYASQVYLGTDDGKRRYKTVYGKTQKEVKAAVSELKIKMGKGIDVAAGDDTFKEWADRFLASKQAEGVGASHMNCLRTFCGHLSPLHEAPLSKITAADIQGVIDRLAVYHEGKPPLSKRTLTGIKQAAGQVYHMAIGARVVEYNPAAYVTIPKNASVTRREAITEKQQRWIRETPHRAQAAAMLMLYAGLRRGEMLALTWGDVDFSEHTVTVNKAIEYIGNSAHLKPPKTQAGNRVVDIPAELVELLRLQKEQDNCTLVVHTRNGKHFSKSSWGKLWNSYMLDLNIKYGYNGRENKFNPRGVQMLIEPFTPHQLRHAFCTMLYAAGYSLLEARDQMGHSDIQTTANIYTHLDKLDGRKTKGKLTKYLCKYSASKNEPREVQNSQ